MSSFFFFSFSFIYFWNIEDISIGTIAGTSGSCGGMRSGWWSYDTRPPTQLKQRTAISAVTMPLNIMLRSMSLSSFSSPSPLPLLSLSSPSPLPLFPLLPFPLFLYELTYGCRENGTQSGISTGTSPTITRNYITALRPAKPNQKVKVKVVKLQLNL